ncbi:hypothetical protein DBT_1737 [Dissulfuribacter thermophilus]|uniref:Uncharacterized protein n=1 Tax=Dissulfuribacter thermophilus TaxID=1156395 RepID=A0A1B9F4U4_9BACT|nr:hypothetical protein [Dissulfuribacter thermophilus]OCC14942.1 hypothetical protein DBT_1737 [Dissulfuribacter thermophilus]
MNLSIRLVPGLFRILPYPDASEFWSFVKSWIVQPKTQLDANSFTTKFSSAQELLVSLEGLSTALRKTQFVPTAVPVIPLQMVAHEGAEPEKSCWQIAPPGYLLVKANDSFPKKEPWLYNYCVVNAAHQFPINNLYFPYRLIYLVGPYKNECFFCGSRYHKTQNCSAFFNGLGNGQIILEKFCKYSPTIWKNIIKGENKNLSFLEGLYSILEDLRYPFRPAFAIKVFGSQRPDTLSNNQLAIEELSGHIKKLFDAIASGDLETLHLLLDEKAPDQPEILVDILKGLTRLYEGEVEEAFEAFQRAEAISKVPNQRAYSALLQSRLQLILGALDRARSSINRAKATLPKDKLIQYWDAIIFSIERNHRGAKNAIFSLAQDNHWLVNLICEPLIIGNASQVEDKFRQKLNDLETQVDQDVISLETLISQTKRAFPKANFNHILVKFRDINGRIPEMGIVGLQQAHNELMALWNQLYDEVNKNYKILYNRLVKARKRMIFCLKKIPSTPKLNPLRNKCLNELEDLTKKIKELRNIKKCKRWKT